MHYQSEHPRRKTVVVATSPPQRHTQTTNPEPPKMIYNQKLGHYIKDTAYKSSPLAAITRFNDRRPHGAVKRININHPTSTIQEPHYRTWILCHTSNILYNEASEKLQKVSWRRFREQAVLYNFMVLWQQRRRMARYGGVPLTRSTSSLPIPIPIPGPKVKIKTSANAPFILHHDPPAREPEEEKTSAVQRILAIRPTSPASCMRILSIEGQKLTRNLVEEMTRKLGLIVHPGRTREPGAREAWGRVKGAAKWLWGYADA